MPVYAGNCSAGGRGEDDADVYGNECMKQPKKKKILPDQFVSGRRQDFFMRIGALSALYGLPL